MATALFLGRGASTSAGKCSDSNVNLLFTADGMQHAAWDG